MHLPVKPAGSQKGRVKGIRPVGSHEDLDVAARVKAVQLVHNLQHGPLHLIVTARPVIEAGAANGIHLAHLQDSSDTTRCID